MRPTFLCVAFLIALPQLGAAPKLPDRHRGPAGGIVGQWRVVFENGVQETCEVGETNVMTVREPLRSSRGPVDCVGRSAVVRFEDGRLESWQLKAGRMVVEHFFPASNYPLGPSIHGTATRAE